MDDVKALKMPPSFLEHMQKSQKSKAASTVMEKAMLKMRELFENGKYRTRTNSEEMT